MRDGFKLDVIIPVRYHDDYDIIKRLEWRKTHLGSDGLGFLVVDDGSVISFSRKIQACCEINGFRYIRIESEAEPFSLSRARNVGIRSSSADYIYFEDVDILAYEGFYNDLKSEIDIQIIKGKRKFVNIPVIYLSEFGTDKVKSGVINNYWKNFFIDESFNPGSKNIQHHAPVSSLFCLSREALISIGGFCEKFSGWGFEDSDFAFKLLSISSVEKPRNFGKLDTRNYSDQVDYNGWRSMFRIYGDMCALKGITVFHAFHLPAKDKSESIRNRNRKIFLENCEVYSAQDYVPEPLNFPGQGKALFFSRNPFSYNEATLPVFNSFLLEDENNFLEKDICQYVKDNEVSIVIFNNPYGTEVRGQIYQKVKDNDIPYLVVERGALPGSIYIDPTGFCAESTMYNKAYWERPLSGKEEHEVLEYIWDFKSSENALERQSDKLGGVALRNKLGISDDGRKVVFIAFQSPSDTTTNLFCGDIDNYDRFIEEVTKVPQKLDSAICLYKNHPLSKVKLNIESAICVDDFHINDILEMSDYVVTLNSGVGVLAMIYNTTVVYFGQTFYAAEGLNFKATSSSDVADVVNSGWKSNKSLERQFLHYLLYKFYSFADWKHGTRRYTDAADMSIATDIRYKRLVVPGYCEKNIEPEFSFNLKRSYLFDRYRMSEYVVNNRVGSGSKDKVKLVFDELGRVVKESPETILARKRRKLRNNPVAYFYDALKNIISGRA